jgi:hypothetical protein
MEPLHPWLIPCKCLPNAKEITQTEYNTLIDLANQAHRMAFIAKAVEDAAANSATAQEFEQAFF